MARIISKTKLDARSIDILNVIRNALKQENSPLVIREYAQVNLENALKETKLIYVLIKALQEANERIDELEKQIKKED